MRRVSLVVGLLFLVLFVRPATAQAPADAPKFDAAEIHLRTHISASGTPVMTGGVLRAGRYDLRNGTMVDLIAMAYGITDSELIVGGPNWLERDRFDIAAKAPEGTAPARVRTMLQQLLADRFGLVVHKDTRPVAGFALTVAKDGKPKMKEAAAEGAGCQPVPQQTPSGGVPLIVASCKGISMASFAQMLRPIGGVYITGPVADLTNLKGFWDFELRWTARPLLALAGSDGIPLPAALENQLGLTLDQQRVPTPVLVVDRVNETPTANPSGIAATIPSPPPMEFDVAEIKLSAPDTQPRLRLLPGGRIEGDGITMRMLFQAAWDITTDDLVANAPKWFDETRYSLVAKTSTAVSGAGQNMNADVDDLKAMLRALITERFQMKSHYEDRPVNGYTLLADKPKMAKADPANRTGWKEGPAVDQKDQRTGMLSRMVTAKNMTMAQFAEDLQRMANGYVHVPVEDKTGLDGAYDFTLTFTPLGLLNVGRGGGPNGAAAGGPASPAGGLAGAAADPSGGLSLPEAINKQLGLKLEMRKRPMPVLVIDSMQEKPIND